MRVLGVLHEATSQPSPGGALEATSIKARQTHSQVAPCFGASRHCVLVLALGHRLELHCSAKNNLRLGTYPTEEFTTGTSNPLLRQEALSAKKESSNKASAQFDTS